MSCRSVLSVRIGHGRIATVTKAGVAGSNPAGGKGQRRYLAYLCKSVHRLFIVYGPVEEVCDRGMHATAGLVLVLSHGDSAVTEMVSADPFGQPFVIDEVATVLRKL
jgi:hypothetical protein